MFLHLIIIIIISGCIMDHVVVLKNFLGGPRRPEWRSLNLRIDEQLWARRTVRTSAQE